MEIREIAIDHYGPLRDARHRPRPGLQIFFGPNESGKTLLIDAILKLMLGSRIKDFAGLDRVPEMPRGRIALAADGREHILDGDTLLDKVVALDNSHLRNIFVIRNKDLNISDQAGYLRRVSDELTGMETWRIDRLKAVVQKMGRLTNPSSAARLSKSADFNHIGEHAEVAGRLAEEIRDYLEQARDKELDALEVRLEDNRHQLKQLAEEIRVQEQARKYQEYTELVAAVAEYETKTAEARDLQEFTHSKLLELQHLDSTARHHRQAAANNREKLAALNEELATAKDRLAATKAQLAPLAKLKPDLERLQQRMQLAAEQSPAPAGQLKAFGYALTALTPLTALVLVLAAMGKLPGALLYTPYFFLLLTLIVLYAVAKALHAQRRHQALLQEGAAAGIMASTLQELAAAVTREKDNLEAKNALLQNLENEVHRLEERVKDLEAAIANDRKEADQAAEQLAQELRRLGADDLEQFARLADEHGRIQATRQELGQRLEKAFGTAPGESGDWRRLLEQLPLPRDPGVDYDKAKLEELRARRDEIQSETDELEKALRQHQSALDRFADACQALPLAEETGRSLPAFFANLEMLEHACYILEQFARSVRARFDTARQVIGILEKLEQEEHKKMARLVGDDSPVQDYFRRVTGGRYTRVVLDDQLNIQVHSKDGLVLPATSLSQGTYDQLYMALRLSLAHDILGGRPGFFILDDAFLCSDTRRLDRLLAVMAEHAQRGWQILYFTVDERMVKAAARYTENPICHLPPLTAEMAEQ
ncbi:MAG: AAA family ATPase [Firmicutes bacterium]|nr:AAA family ATPase [Bacillota bacterium]HOB34300.1 AAA family ATPase [Bacillota bacterium]HPZ90693.1 AAA family ATPase [Bacillota bacterium]HQE01511.1 AAA family ATPase [Bacillota bacterium]